MMRPKTPISTVILVPIIVLALIYSYSMFIHPWFAYDKWSEVQNVWSRWQGLNTGILAFVAAILALKRNQTIAHAERQAAKEELFKQQQKRDYELQQQNNAEIAVRNRQLRSALSFLPQELSILSEYCDNSMRYLSDTWHYLQSDGGLNRILDDSFLSERPPILTERHQQVFSDCMEFGSEGLYNSLSAILRNLQIHDARTRILPDELRPDIGTIVFPQNIISYLYMIAQTKTIIGRLFGYSRDGENLDSSVLLWEEYRTAFRTADVDPEEINGLREYIERAIARQIEIEGQNN